MACPEIISLWLGDTFLACFLLFPTMVFYWRGIWDLVGVYIFPDDELKRCWTIVGMGSATIFGYALHPIMDVTLRQMSRRWRLVLTRVYMAVYAVLPMSYWHGVWVTADYYLHQYGWQAGVIGYVICELVLNIFRVRQTAIFPPLVVVMDTRKDVLRPSTRYGIKPSLTWRYSLDALFSHFIALTFTIVLWRSAWVCVDQLFISTDYFISNLWSLVIGYGASIGILLMDPLFLKVARKISGHVTSPRRQFLTLLVWENSVYVLAFWCHLFIWRGGWNLNAEYIIKDKEIGGWVNNLVGTVGFLVLQIYSYVGACGCVVDGHINGTEDRWFPTHYLTVIVPYFRKTKNCCGTEELDDKSDKSSVTNEKVIYAVDYDNSGADFSGNGKFQERHTSSGLSSTVHTDIYTGSGDKTVFDEGIVNPGYMGVLDTSEFTHM